MFDSKENKIELQWRFLEHYGRVLYGSAWQTDLSAALDLKDPSHLRGWKSRGVPKRIWPMIHRIGENKIAEIKKEITIVIK